MITQSAFRSNRDQYTVVDVRTIEERHKAFIPGSLHIPLADLVQRQNEIPRHQAVAVVCGTGGGRSIEGAQVLVELKFHADWLEGGTLGTL
jgi:rhodanese-related sulfurtransferase